MQTIELILEKIAGKKTTIFSILQSIVVYLLATGTISNEVGVLLTSILTALAGGSNYASYKLGKAK
jgi:hypothetical protein